MAFGRLWLRDWEAEDHCAESEEGECEKVNDVHDVRSWISRILRRLEVGTVGFSGVHLDWL